MLVDYCNTTFGTDAPMSAATPLMPHLALQLTSGIHAHQSLALLSDFMSRVDHPFIREGMFEGPDSAVSNVFGKVPDVGEDLRFRDLRQPRFWVDTWERNTSSVASTSLGGLWGTRIHSSVTGFGRAASKMNKDDATDGDEKGIESGLP